MNFKELLFKEEAPKPATGQSAPKPQPERIAKVAPVAPWPTAPSMPLSGVTPVYISLKDKMDFDKTDAGMTLAKYLTPLKAVNIDERAKYHAAVAQASAIEGLSVAKILATFDGLKHGLQDELANFGSEAKEREDDLAVKIRQRDMLRAQLTALESEIQSTTDKVTKAREDFRTAVDSLTQELENQKARYTGLLQG